MRFAPKVDADERAVRRPRHVAAAGPKLVKSRKALHSFEQSERRRRAGEVASGFLSPAEFERVVSEALETLPKRFADLVVNVVVTVEDEPSDDDFENVEDDAHAGSELLGIYRGVPLTKRSHDMPMLPDQIAIFRGPINRISRSRTQAVQQVRDTVIHELGHYFGLSDEEMPH
jgi:predicted Zn-dependent protease with MMP-like domain